ncbi:MAG: MarR family winged helix-turn-helix transcriptional regulator [Pseudomonadota bacterium]
MDVKPAPSVIELDAFLPYQITRLADQIARRTAAIAKRHDGLNLSQWRVLAAVAERPGRTANEVVAVTPMDKGIVSRAVKSLIEMNLISRKASKKDGRISRLFLTVKGRRSYDAMAAEIRGVDETLRAPLSQQEYAHLQDMLQKLILQT